MSFPKDYRERQDEKDRISAGATTFYVDLSDFISLQRIPVCPNCLGLLDKMPARKQKCKLCGEIIRVIHIPNEDTTLLLNELEGAKLTKLIEDYYSERAEVLYENYNPNRRNVSFD